MKEAPVLQKTQFPYYYYPLAGLGMLFVSLFITFLVVNMPFLTLGALLLSLVFLAVWRWPIAGVLSLVIFLPFHQIFLMLLLQAGFPGEQLFIMQSWKDIIVLVLFLKLLFMIVNREIKIEVNFLDLLVFFFLILEVFYLFVPNDLTLINKLYAIRTNSMFLFLYFAGRFLPFSRDDLRKIVISVIAVAAIYSVVGIVENRFFEQFRDFLSLLGYEKLLEVAPFLIPEAVVRLIGETEVTRIGSVFLGYLTLAFSLLLVIPLNAALASYFKKFNARFYLTLALGLFFLTLLFTGTRSAYLVAILGVLIVIVYTREWKYWLPVGILLLFLLIPAVYFYLPFTELYRATLALEESSTRAHLNAWQDSLEVLSTNPLGQGLGTAGLMAVRVESKTAIVNESWYFQIGTELGLLGMFLFVAITVGLLLQIWSTQKRVEDTFLKYLTIALFSAGLGYAFVGLVLHVWESPAVTFIFWLLAGIILQAKAVEKRV